MAQIRRTARVGGVEFSFFFAARSGSSGSSNSDAPDVEVRALGGRSFDTGSDAVHYAVSFKPPLAANVARSAYLTALYRGAAGAKGDGAKFCLWPTTPGVAEQRVTVGSRQYASFETHALRLLAPTEQPRRKKKRAKTTKKSAAVAPRVGTERVDLMYVALENNQTTSAEAVQLEPETELGGWLAARYPGRYVPLSFFPPDPQILFDAEIRASGGIESRLVPQRTPLWFKLRSEVSGTAAYKLLGFYVPSRKEDPKWSYDAPAKFGAWQRANMRFGRLHEAHMVIAYLEAYPERTFREVGTVPHPREPSLWGASPDGVIDDPERGVVAAEFKASRRDCNAKAYYWPQLYMEMGALETQHADLVRYAERTEMVSNRWLKRREIRVFPVQRDAHTEDRLIRCLVRAYANRNRLQTIVCEEEFVALRAHFEQEAANAPYTHIHGEQADAAIEHYEAARRDVIRGPELPQQTGAWAELERRHAQVYELAQKTKQAKPTDEAKAKLLSLALKQIAAYATILDD